MSIDAIRAAHERRQRMKAKIEALPPEARAKVEAHLEHVRSPEGRAEEEEIRRHYADHPSVATLVERGEVAGPGPGAVPGAYAIRVRRPGFVDRLIVEGHPTPHVRADMAQCSDSPGDWGRPPRTYESAATAERHRRVWEECYPGYTFELVERVLVPAWRAAGEGG